MSYPTEWTAAEIRSHCWLVEKEILTVEIPEGMEVWEEEDFIFLLCGDEVVERFLVQDVDQHPEMIRKAAESYVMAKQEK